MTARPSLAQLAADLATGRTTSRALVEEALSRIADPAGEGSRVFVKVYADAARMAADAQDRLRRAGYVASTLAGIPVSIKDLFDVAGEVTLAGSRALDDTPAATADAPIVARLKAAGAVIIGRTNMTEFAFSGVGINPHYGTPGNPYDRSLIPGGSSAGAPVSVAGGMAAVAIGTDTGGVGSYTGGAVRARRVQADPVPGAARRRHTAFDHLGLDRPDRRQRRLLRIDRRGHGRRAASGARCEFTRWASPRHSADGDARRS